MPPLETMPERKAANTLASLISHPPASCHSLPLARPTQKPTVRDPGGLSCDIGQAWGQGRPESKMRDARYSAGRDSSKGMASEACSDICSTYQLGVRAGPPEMSLGRVSRAFSICVSLGMGSTAASQFPSLLPSGLKYEHILGRL